MAEEESGFVVSEVADFGDGRDLLERLFDVAEPGAVFSEPVEAGEHTLIMASEAVVSLGFGYGFGAGTAGPEAAEADVASLEPGEVDEPRRGRGGGGGGGGYSGTRAVAVISAGPEGVKVDPVVDVTKVVLAFFTMIGGFLLLLGKMRQAMKG